MNELLSPAATRFSRSDRALAVMAAAVITLYFAVGFGTSIGKFIYIITH